MRVSAWQHDAADPTPRLDALARAARAARTAGAELLVTPEMALSGYAIGAKAVADAAADPALWEGVCSIAQHAGIALVAGGPVASPGGTLNAARLIDRTGAVRATYAKTHLFGEVDRAQFVAGAAIQGPVALSGTAIGLAICYDIEFPEMARALVLAGAGLMAVPTANMAPFQSVCTRLVPARAEENTTPVVYANYVGEEGPFTYCGLSCIAAADGTLLAQAPPSGPAVITAELAPEATAAARRRIGYLADRRPALYGPLAGEGS